MNFDDLEQWPLLTSASSRATKLLTCIPPLLRPPHVTERPSVEEKRDKAVKDVRKIVIDMLLNKGSVIEAAQGDDNLFKYFREIMSQITCADILDKTRELQPDAMQGRLYNNISMYTCVLFSLQQFGNCHESSHIQNNKR
jgi:hypothetical protein